mgnify:CR=1 FL=1
MQYEPPFYTPRFSSLAHRLVLPVSPSRPCRSILSRMRPTSWLLG